MIALRCLVLRSKWTSSVRPELYPPDPELHLLWVRILRLPVVMDICSTPDRIRRPNWRSMVSCPGAGMSTEGAGYGPSSTVTDSRGIGVTMQGDGALAAAQALWWKLPAAADAVPGPQGHGAPEICPAPRLEPFTPGTGHPRSPVSVSTGVVSLLQHFDVSVTHVTRPLPVGMPAGIRVGIEVAGQWAGSTAGLTQRRRACRRSDQN